MNKICGIYKIHCVVNDKLYIGSSINIERRWKTHKNQLNRNGSSSVKLQRAWLKYKASNFKFTVIEQCDVSILYEREQFYIDFYQSASEEGYNTSVIAGASPMLHRRHSDESKQKMRKSATGRVLSEESKLKISKNNAKNMLGKHHSDENKEKLKIASTGNSNALGYRHTDEAKKKMSIAATGNKRNLGRVASAETRAKISSIVKGRKQSPESIAKNVETRKKNRELKFKSLYQQMTNIISEVSFGK